MTDFQMWTLFLLSLIFVGIVCVGICLAEINETIKKNKL